MYNIQLRLILIGMPMLVGFTILALLFLFLKKRRPTGHPNVIMCASKYFIYVEIQI